MFLLILPYIFIFFGNNPCIFLLQLLFYSYIFLSRTGPPRESVQVYVRQETTMVPVVKQVLVPVVDPPRLPFCPFVPLPPVLPYPTPFPSRSPTTDSPTPVSKRPTSFPTLNPTNEPTFFMITPPPSPLVVVGYSTKSPTSPPTCPLPATSCKDKCNITTAQQVGQCICYCDKSCLATRDCCGDFGTFCQTGSPTLPRTPRPSGGPTLPPSWDRVPTQTPPPRRPTSVNTRSPLIAITKYPTLNPPTPPTTKLPTRQPSRGPTKIPTVAPTAPTSNSPSVAPTIFNGQQTTNKNNQTPKTKFQKRIKTKT